jgi:hypothetical protein
VTAVGVGVVEDELAAAVDQLRPVARRVVRRCLEVRNQTARPATATEDVRSITSAFYDRRRRARNSAIQAAARSPIQRGVRST